MEKEKTVVILAANKGFSGLRLAKNGALKVMFHEGESQDLNASDAKVFLAEYPNYSKK